MENSKFSHKGLAILCLASIIIIATGCKKDDVKKPPTAPVVSTAALTNVTSSGATGGGSIVSDGGDVITASGIVWSETNAMPTLSDSVVAGTSANGTFTVNISGLQFDKSYYIRAFATNSVGTGYGEVVTLNTTNDTNKVRFTYNGEEVEYGIIVSPTTGRRWLDRNLGAKKAADSLQDYNAYGDLFQWGRPDDGHQLINWTNSTTGAGVNGTTAVQSTSDVPGHSAFILTAPDGSGLADWRNDNNRNRWVTNPQGPCPAGWHVPTRQEWAAEISSTNGYGTATSGGVLDGSTAYSLLKLTLAGYRRGLDDGRGGQIAGDGPASSPGALGDYWGSSDQINGSFSWGDVLQFGGNFVNLSLWLKAEGYSVRCMKD